MNSFGGFSGKPVGAEPGKSEKFWINDNGKTFNACWIGQSEFASHVVSHNNAGLPQMSGNFSLFTLSDAVDYVRFLAEFTCNFQRFAAMVPNCGRPVLTATLTPDGFVEGPTGAL